MMQSQNLFQSWLKYRIDVCGQKQTAVIKEINEKLSVNYTASHFWRWAKQTVSTPDQVLSIVNEELAEVLEYVFLKEGFNADGVNFQSLALSLKAPIKSEVRL